MELLYAHISFLVWLGTLFLILYGAFIRLWLPGLLDFVYPDSPAFWVPVGLGLHFFFPVLLELLYNLLAWLCGSKYTREHSHDEYMDKSGIIYSSGYNISFFGLEKFHPFDPQKYGRCFNFLCEDKVISGTTRVHSPKVCPRFLLLPLSKLYLLSHCYMIFNCLFLEVPLYFIPGCLYRYRVLNPMLRATMGSIEGCCIALEKGWAINLSGGYHHARRNWGGGFCVYPDIYLAVTHLRRWHPATKRVMVIDLDVHQGNGHERDFTGDADVYIVDMYNHDVYPGDEVAKEKIGKDVMVTPADTARTYIAKLNRALDAAFAEFREVDFIIYNAGTDILEGDPLGGLHIPSEGVIRRDEIVFRAALERHIPILMLLSGGYQLGNARVIADSIKNLFEKFPQMSRSVEV